jgi:plastocyanin
VQPGTPARSRAAALVLRCAPALAAAVAILATACGGGASEPPAPPAGAIPAGTSIGGASVSGRVLFRGTPPERRPIKMSGEAACHRPGAVALSEEVIAGSDGALQNAYVHVVSGLGDRVFAPPGQPAVMDQAGCVFRPHVLAVQSNQVITFKNSDPAVHNVRARAQKNPTFNISLAGQGRTARRYFGEPEMVAVRCDIHAWMGAYVAVERHPFFAVTGDDGRFLIEGLPAGEYVIEAWQESLGTERQTIRLADGEHRELSFAFGK